MFKSILFTVFSLLFICGSISSYSIRRSSSSSSSIHSSVQRVLRDYDASIESLRTLHSTFQVLADPASNAACSSALTAADASIKANCSATFLSSESLDLAPLLAENAVVGPICATKIASTDAAKCIAAFTAAYQSSINICGANNSTDVVAKIQAAVGGESFFNGLSQLVTLGQAICTKDGDTYCYDALNTLVKASGNPFSNIANINNTVASALCTPCSKKFLNNLQSVGVINITAYPSLGGLLTGLKFICISDPTNPSNQCMDSVALLTKFQGQNAAGISNIISTLSKTDVNLLCSPCTSAVINSADTLTAVGVPANAIAALKAAGPYIAGLCVKDASNGNDYCAYRLGGPLGQWATTQISSVANLAPLYTACKTSFDEGFTTCSAGCSAAISALFAQFGCCLGVATDNGKNKDPFIAAIQAAAASAPSGTTDQIVLALQKCTITFVQSCAPPTAVPLSVTFILDNIKSSWATDASVLTDFKNAFTADVASAFGLDASAITGITVADNGKGATKITFTINTKADIVAGLKATIVSRINTKTMTFGQTSALAASNAAVAKVDASSGVEASTTSTVDGGGASAAFVSKNIMGSFVLTILSFIAIKLF